MQVNIYSTTTCPYCRMLKSYLDDKSVAYTEKIVDQDQSAQEEMVKESGGFMGVPFTVIIKDDGTKEKIVGFDKNKVNEILGIS